MEYIDVLTAYESIKDKIPFKADTGIVLGSGLNGFADEMKISAVIAYNEIAGFPVSTVDGHKGQFVFGTTKQGKRIVLMQGRVHFYEGYTMQQVVMPIRMLSFFGVKKLLLTNAAGGINDSFYAGAFMMITDHIMNVPSPLIGKNISEFGIRFPDMTNIYDVALCDKIRAAAKEANVKIFEGVYVQLTGPNFETPAEIKMWQTLGADAVGMSTACEAVTARHLGIKVCGISCISNLAAGKSASILSHTEVNETTSKVKPQFSGLINRVLENI